MGLKSDRRFLSRFSFLGGDVFLDGDCVEGPDIAGVEENGERAERSEENGRDNALAKRLILEFDVLFVVVVVGGVVGDNGADVGKAEEASVLLRLIMRRAFGLSSA